MRKVTIQLEIEKPDWLDVEALRRAIEEQAKWKLATGGSKIISSKIVENAQAGADQDNTDECLPSIPIEFSYEPDDETY